MAQSNGFSVVVCGRNDNYGTDWKERFDSNLIYSLTDTPHELICVEWNPPEGPKLSSLPWTRPIRFIEVPKELHEILPNPEGFPILEYHARNVGIRRATADWILVTNTDIDLTEVLEELDAQKLDPNNFYRAIRVDYAPHTGLVVKENTDPGPFGLVHTNASGDFILAHKNALHKVRGFPELPTMYFHGDSYLVCQLHASGLKQQILNSPIYHQNHPRRDKPAPSDWWKDCMGILYGARSWVINDSNWGLKGRHLEEICL